MATKSKYFIYHIPGIKIGVTQNIKHRIVTTQKFTEYEILEEHTNAKEVSKREKILQAQYGYPVDKIEYWKTLRWQKKSQTSKAQKKRVANIDWKAKVANTDYKVFQAKRVANTDYKTRTSKMDYSNNKIPQSAYTPEAQAKRVASRDWKIHSTQLKKPVNQYDLEGNFIKRWDGAKDAAKELNIHNTSISMCCKGKQKTYKNYKWNYAG